MAIRVCSLKMQKKISRGGGLCIIFHIYNKLLYEKIFIWDKGILICTGNERSGLTLKSK